MAKIRHRLFEIFETEQEASDALASKSARVNKHALDPDLWRFHQLDVSISPSGVTHVKFKQSKVIGPGVVSELSKDLMDLAGLLTNDSRVLLDFAGVQTFEAEAINKLGELRTKLQSKGSNFVLCNLETEAHASFFPHLSKNVNR